ncbi:MAG TPA: chemotaxis protein CheW [Nitrospirota bacterium]|nr:chemotaxis protein CheW [Nitrospirota bacterium]
MAEINNDVAADALDVLPEEEEVQICLFSIGDETYAIPVEVLIEIIISQKIFPVPTTPSHVLGVINLRGNIVPVVDIRPTLSLPQSSVPGQIAIIKQESMMLGILVDNVSAVISLPISYIQPLPSETGPQQDAKSHARFLRGIIHQDTGVVALLNIERVIDEIMLT